MYLDWTLPVIALILVIYDVTVQYVHAKVMSENGLKDEPFAWHTDAVIVMFCIIAIMRLYGY